MVELDMFRILQDFLVYAADGVCYDMEGENRVNRLKVQREEKEEDS
jgi:hypothetical protein